MSLLVCRNAETRGGVAASRACRLREPRLVRLMLQPWQPGQQARLRRRSVPQNGEYYNYVLLLSLLLPNQVFYIYVNKNESPNVLLGGKLENRQSIRF